MERSRRPRAQCAMVRPRRDSARRKRSPGPPLNTNVTGRRAFSAPSSWNATKASSARGACFSSVRRMAPAVASKCRVRPGSSSVWRVVAAGGSRGGSAAVSSDRVAADGAGSGHRRRSGCRSRPARPVQARAAGQCRWCSSVMTHVIQPAAPRGYRRPRPGPPVSPDAPPPAARSGAAAIGGGRRPADARGPRAAVPPPVPRRR